MAMTRKDLHEYAETYWTFKTEANNPTGVWPDTLDRIHRYERNLHGLFETACNRDLTAAEQNRVMAIKVAVTNIADTLGFKVRFNSDPRGGAIRFVLPSGKSNNWDGETWGIYW